MSIFLDPTGKSTYGIAICDRCNRKFSLDDLFSDPNSPGLKVCREDMDDYDPYRLPARRTEDIHLRFTRPDEELTTEGPDPQEESTFANRTAGQHGIRYTTDGRKRTFLPPLPDDPA